MNSVHFIFLSGRITVRFQLQQLVNAQTGYIASPLYVASTVRMMHIVVFFLFFLLQLKIYAFS